MSSLVATRSGTHLLDRRRALGCGGWGLNDTLVVMPMTAALRIIVSSSNYPRFSVNPQNGLTIMEAEGNPSVPAVVATNTIHLSGPHASHITLPVVSMGQLPKFHPIALADELMTQVNKGRPADQQLELKEFLAIYDRMLKEATSHM
jgi:hypothetical protein